jgi:CheY-like chemotaxis protein
LSAEELETLGGSETILLVDDQDDARTLARRILEKSGYRVLEAHNGAEGLRVCRQHQGRIDLMITDVVMPELSGLQLAERVAESRSDMRILFTSGYAQSATGQHVLSPSTPFLQKPFTVESLTRRVREMLDTPVDSPRSSPTGPTVEES